MGMTIHRRHFVQVATAALAAPASIGRAAAADPAKIRVGWVVAPASLAPLVLEKREMLQNFGKTYIAEATRFEGTPQVITALAVGEIDIGPLAFSSFGLAIQNAGLTDLRVIRDEIQDGVPGHATNLFLVRADSPIKTVADLKGKILATNAQGSAVDIAMKAMLRKAGLEAQRDYTIVEAPFPTMRAMLADKKADLVSAVPPFSLDPELLSIGRTLFTQKDAFGTTQLTLWSARTPFIEKNRAALVDFLTDVTRVARWYEDPANHKEAIAAVGRVTKVAPERFDWAFTARDQYRDPNGMPNLEALQANLDQTRAAGLLKDTIDVKTFTDVSMAREAAARLK